VRAWAGVYDPATGWTGDVAPPRTLISRSAALPDGRVLFAGGTTPPGSVRPDEIVPWIDIFE
jgi:hypothetical protein